MSDISADLPEKDLPEGAEAAQRLAADASPDEATMGQGSPDADKIGGAMDGESSTGGVVDSGMPDLG